MLWELQAMSCFSKDSKQTITIERASHVHGLKKKNGFCPFPAVYSPRSPPLGEELLRTTSREWNGEIESTSRCGEIEPTMESKLKLVAVHALDERRMI